MLTTSTTTWQPKWTSSGPDVFVWTYIKQLCSVHFRPSVVGLFPHQRFQTAKTDYSCHFRHRDTNLAVWISTHARRSELVHGRSENVQQPVSTEQKYSQAAVCLVSSSDEAQTSWISSQMSGKLHIVVNRRHPTSTLNHVEVQADSKSAQAELNSHHRLTFKTRLG